MIKHHNLTEAFFLLSASQNYLVHLNINILSFFFNSPHLSVEHKRIHFE